MEAKELMIGDWVIHTQTIDRNLRILEKPIKVYTRVESILEDGINQDNCQGCDDYVEIESVGPIPLTEEILEKNGFVKHIETGPYFGYYHTYNGITIFNSRVWHNCIIKSVHELQHILRICGLTELADNFKIE